ncbi:MAG TPA: GntR family transcriptional regulator [Sulfurovum sp.]|nr:GntR family transcriptional regulator [Sulfurovum sp.]
MSLSQYYIDKDSKAPLYLQVEDIISDLLLNEPYKSGDKLPNEIEISDRLGVSRNTVRKAMYGLINKNLIVRKKNRGTFKNIENQRIKTTLNNWYSFNEDMKSQKKDFKIFEYIPSYIEPSKEVCEKLSIKPNKKIIRLLRAKGYLEPEQYVESYFHPDLGLELAEIQSQEIMKLYEFLEDRLDIKIVFSHEEISASVLTEEMQRHLSVLDESIPVIIRKMLIHDEDGKKIAYSIGYYLSNRFVFNLNISR